ncbi:MAG TPA: DUF2846 domain-containing protein [Burkholderiales bacterium]|nr:DUF2846 domain-containing protein [Burkholderiales bacterium]
MQTAKSLVIAAAALLAGCAAEGIRHADLQASMPALRPGDGRIYFYRVDSILGAAIQPDLRLNGEVVGESIPGGFFFLDRRPGKYEAHATTEVERSVTFTLAAGETKYIRTSTTFGLVAGHLAFDLVSRSEAESELPSLRYTGKAASFSTRPDTMTPQEDGNYPRTLNGPQLAGHFAHHPEIRANSKRQPFTLIVRPDGKVERDCPRCQVPYGEGTMTFKEAAGLVCIRWKGVSYPTSGCFQLVQTGANSFEMRKDDREVAIEYSVTP